MNPYEVVHQPVDIECSLQVISGFSIGISFTSKGSITPSEGGIESFHMIGMNALPNYLLGLEIKLIQSTLSP